MEGGRTVGREGGVVVLVPFFFLVAGVNKKEHFQRS